ncbi:hypothetical protein KJS94_11970 [Flavihumibacter rivuli]|uniref:hypothetical protein n=1 Tax=Flavihumibacter rivuli TaxID=2838156 RepID=UPI001BDDCD19|nr:hypothetical protein [Flavihumibacter rivuli]ULQ55358.1 hypothetical protein KJS94_11970 [Flavihumibacter rivuli]
MVTLRRKFFVFPIYDNWFGAKKGIWNSLYFNSYLHVPDDLKNPLLIRKDNHTVELDLSRNNEEIFEGFARTVKAQVKQCERDGLQSYFDQDIDKFIAFFNPFAEQKGIPKVTRKMMEEFGPMLRISYAEQDGTILAAHTHLFDAEEKIVRQMHSASLRFDQGFDKNKIGRANKFLHYRDMLAFKEQGILYYDFGGYFKQDTTEEITSLLNFKLDFGAYKKLSYNYFTLSYHLTRKMMKSFGLIGAKY